MMKKKKKKNYTFSFSSFSALLPFPHFSSRGRERHANLQVYRHRSSSLISLRVVFSILLLIFFLQTFFFFFERKDNCLFIQAHRIPFSPSSSFSLSCSPSSSSPSSSLVSPCLLPSRQSRRTLSSSSSSLSSFFLSFFSPLKSKNEEKENPFSKKRDNDKEKKTSSLASICTSEEREREKLEKRRRSFSPVSLYSFSFARGVKDAKRKGDYSRRRTFLHGNERQRRRGRDLRYIYTFLDVLYLLKRKKEGEKKILRDDRKDKEGFSFHLIRSDVFLYFFFISPFLPVFPRFLSEYVSFFFSCFFSLQRRRERRYISHFNPLCLKCRPLSSPISSSSSPLLHLSLFSESSCDPLRLSFLLDACGTEKQRKKKKNEEEEESPPVELRKPRKRERVKEREKCSSFGEKCLSFVRKKGRWKEEFLHQFRKNQSQLTKILFLDENKEEEKEKKQKDEEETSLDVKAHLKHAQAQLIRKLGDLWKRGKKRDTVKGLSRREEEERDVEETSLDMKKRNMKKLRFYGGIRDLKRGTPADLKISWSMRSGKNDEETTEAVSYEREIERTLLTLKFLQEYQEEIYNLFALDFSPCLGGLGLAFERKASKLRCTYTRIFRSTSHDIITKLIEKPLSNLFFHRRRISCSRCCHICKTKERFRKEKEKEKKSVQDKETSLSLLLRRSTPKKALLFLSHSPSHLPEKSEREEEKSDRQEKKNEIGLYSENGDRHSSSFCGSDTQKNLRKEENKEEQEENGRREKQSVDRVSSGDMFLKEEEREENFVVEIDLERLKCLACLEKDLEEKMKSLIEERRIEGRELQEEKKVLAQDYYLKCLKALWRDVVFKRLFPLLLQILSMKIKAIVLHEWRKRRERKKEIKGRGRDEDVDDEKEKALKEKEMKRKKEEEEAEERRR